MTASPGAASPTPPEGTLSVRPPGQAPGSPAASGAARRFSREDVLRLGRSARPWEFIPVGVAALRAAPGDDAVRFLLAAALGRLALRTLALEQLALLSAPAKADPAVPHLKGALHELAPDELTAESRIATARANVGVLGDRAQGLREALPAWEARARAFQAYRTLDSNVVRRRAGETNPSNWIHLANHADAASSFVAHHVEGKPAPRPPMTLEGLDPPWLLSAIARATPPDPTGLHSRLVLVQADPLEALDGLSLTDLREWLAPTRVMLFVGADASSRLGAWTRANLARRLSGPFVPLMSVRTRAEPGVAGVLQEGTRAQEARAGELRSRLMARDRARSASERAARFASWTRRPAVAGSDPPGATPHDPTSPALRILLPTCRYTTFLRHAAADLRDAFERIGCRAELLIEPDDATQMSSVAYLDALDRVDPDLVVMVNYTRAQMGGLIPPGVPVVCWVQDMMPHLFTRESGQSQGPLDFVAGHCGEDLFTRYGYSRDRAIGSPVVASERKFHPEPVPESVRERFACEIACVTHHSESVEAMHRRLRRESAADPDAAGVMDELLPLCVEVARDARDANVWTELRRRVQGVLARRHPHAANPDVEGAFLRNYAMPVADRAFRHQALEWAASIARRRSWRLRIYGRGWDSHPTLAPFAAGLTEHGEELRAAYQCASVNLHLCLSTLMHQRPMECVLSGGLPVVRPTRDALAALNGRAQARVAERGTEAAGIEPTLGLPYYPFEATPEGERYRDLTERLGMTLRFPGIVIRPERLEAMRRRRDAEPLEADPTWLFGDLPQIAFHDERGLEALVERAIEQPQWRAEVARDIADRVRDRLTHAALAGRILHAVAARAVALAQRSAGRAGSEA